MTAREELEKLAKECEECAGKDVVSFEEHFEKCPACQERKAKAEKLAQIADMMQMLASKPEEDRRQIFSARMEQFSSLPEDKRIAAITDMLDGIAELPEEDRIKVVKTRIDLMAKLPKEKREILMGSLKKIMSSWPEERKMMERHAVMAATQDYFILKRMMIRNMFKKMLM
ncbi:hypothetical protein ANME2D_02526 [Candidatus Methanoperedens nitroreducens]|uniref:Uncharacterized protein n=1 Tax=Candidatus Methanoperedens nitratireducens TaxID=1392998 RepID=A0A062UTZ8_9EURY|nr:hypothetical protein [Candidatus Methanoperedens nitroreducens]KCZ70506.1 hypothetical protein ANME2D_02526 [Candidatus Methanoperedens nitroreducens]MDJ1420357.1 hypothetical protein [Candidatus Methanoperedens sp.]